MEFQGILHTIFWELANLNICFTGDSFWLNQNEFYLRRLHSLLGIIPIGAFLIVHLLVNHQATQGAEAFNKASGFMESLPFLIVVEFYLFIFHCYTMDFLDYISHLLQKKTSVIILYLETGCSSSNV